ncbi:MAG: murein biosynthesis integral membrane protein MurJ [Pelagibacterales bacterium]|nr:murein biosynthesis integral membrane protein MurJ [Pelagibacterales bacterium]
MKKKTNNFFKSFSLMSFLTLISRIIGYIRDLFFAFLLGASPLADSFLLAFRIPNFFRRLFAEGAINNAFIPVYLVISNKKNQNELRMFSGSLFLFLIIILLIVLALGELFMLEIVRFLAPNFSYEMQSKTVYLASIMFPYLLFISASSFLGALLNANRRFLMSAFLPIVLNFFMVLGMVLAFYKSLNIGVVLSLSVLFAGFTQFFLIFFWTRHLKINLIITKPKLSKDIKKFFKLLFPNLLAGGVVQINQFVGVIFASSIPGAISWLYYADRIVQLPLGIFIISISTILLTSLSSPTFQKDSTKFKQQIEKAIEIIFGISFLSCIGLLVLSDLIIDILFRRGQFGYGDVKATSEAIIMYSFGLPAFGLIKIFSTIYFSHQDTKTPFRISFFSMILNFIIIYILIDNLGHLGIALALSISSWINAIFLYIFIHKRGYWRIDFSFFKKSLKLFLVFIITLNVVHGLEYSILFFDLLSTSNIFKKILLLTYLIIFSIITFILFCIIFRILSIKDLSKRQLFNMFKE